MFRPILPVAVLVAAQAAFAQSDPVGFTTSYTAPPDTVPRVIGSETQVNVFEGGSLPSFFEAGSETGGSSNIEVNVFGGSGGPFGWMRFYGGTTLNVMGGTLALPIDAYDSVVDIAGGGIEQLSAYGSEVNFSGGDATGITADEETSVRVNGGVINSLRLRGSSAALVSDAAHVRSASVGDATLRIASGELDWVTGTGSPEATSRTEIVGGKLGTVWMFSGATAILSGGIVDAVFADSDSRLELHGNEFQINGQPVDPATPDLPSLGATDVLR